MQPLRLPNWRFSGAIRLRQLITARGPVMRSYPYTTTRAVPLVTGCALREEVTEQTNNLLGLLRTNERLSVRKRPTRGGCAMGSAVFLLHAGRSLPSPLGVPSISAQGQTAKNSRKALTS